MKAGDGTEQMLSGVTNVNDILRFRHDNTTKQIPLHFLL